MSDPSSPPEPRQEERDPQRSPELKELFPFPNEAQFLRLLSKFVRDRVLYPEHHPQIVADITMIKSALPLLFTGRSERTFVFIEDQIFVDDRLLTHTQRNLPEISKIFLETHIDALTFRQGLTWDEFGSFLNYLLALKEGLTQQPEFSSAHIEIRALSALGGAKQPVSPVIQDMSASASRRLPKNTPYADEAKMIQEVYTNWDTAQEALIGLVVKIIHALEKCLFQNHQSFVPLADLKSYDEYTYVHAINLAVLTMAQAEYMGFPKGAVHAFGVGALLHDVGKTQIPAHILNKQGKLTAEEFDEMKKHPVLGAAVLLQYPEIPRISVIVAYEHHLKYDGTGYPLMKQKRRPHIASRFTAISDQFDALRSNRPYRDAMPTEKIFELMQESRGTGLDPHLLDQFVIFMKSKKIS